MASNFDPVFALTPALVGATFVAADTTTKKNLITGGTNSTRIDSIFCCSNDSADENLAFYINDGSTDYYIGNVPVPAGSGYTNTIRVEALKLLGAYCLGNALVLKSGHILKCNSVATVTAAKTITVVATGGDF